MKTNIPYKLSIKEIEEIKELARAKRSALGFGNDAPIANEMPLVLESLHITSLEFPIKGNDESLAFSAMLLYSKPLTFIGINTADYYDRQIFAIAHELYHFYTKTSSQYSEDEHGGDSAVEIKANRFAAEFLLPEEGLRRRIASEFGSYSLKNVQHQTLLRFIARIHCTWYLPYRSVIRRLDEIEAITTHQCQRLLTVDERALDGEYTRLGQAIDKEVFTKLNTRTEVIGTSAHAIETIIRNFEHKIIDEQTFVETLKLFNKSPNDFGYEITVSQEDIDEFDSFIRGWDSEG